jgi:hypothetical protein
MRFFTLVFSSKNVSWSQSQCLERILKISSNCGVFQTCLPGESSTGELQHLIVITTGDSMKAGYKKNDALMLGPPTFHPL